MSRAELIELPERVSHAASPEPDKLASTRGECEPSHCENAPPRIARILLLGCGTVGSAVAQRLRDIGGSLGVQLTRVLVRDTTRPRDIPRELLTTSFEQALAEKPDLVIELLGGTDPALAHVRAALERGIPVVTANKTLVARHGAELEDAARRGGTRFVYEAAVCAAIPVFAALRHLEGDRVRRIAGIVNGSCNFILSRMSRGASYETALNQAAARGLVEPDPHADVSGRDSAEKLLLLAAACHPSLPRLSYDRIQVTGITGISSDDILAARRSGHVIKLIAEYDPGAGILRVGPTFIPNDHVLASVSDEENALIIETELAGELILRGKGAGPKPTASAILGDVVRVLNNPGASPRRLAANLSHSRQIPSPTPAERDDPSPDPLPASTRSGETSGNLHYVRIDRVGVTPDEVLERLNTRSIFTRELAISRDGARVLVHVAHEHRLRAALTSLVQRSGDAVITLPVWRTTHR